MDREAWRAVIHGVAKSRLCVSLSEHPQPGFTRKVREDALEGDLVFVLGGGPVVAAL